MLNWQPLRAKALCQLCVLGFFGVAVGCFSTHNNAIHSKKSSPQISPTHYPSSPPTQ